jgi:hypothetical protein
MLPAKQPGTNERARRGYHDGGGNACVPATSGSFHEYVKIAGYYPPASAGAFL